MRTIMSSTFGNQAITAWTIVYLLVTEYQPFFYSCYYGTKLTRVKLHVCHLSIECIVPPNPKKANVLLAGSRDHVVCIKELKRLRSELCRKSEQLVDKRHLLQIDEQRRQAEADKLAAITELETKSRQFMVEKKEKHILEQKIAALQGQLIIGGDGLQVTPAMRKMLQTEQHKIHSEYESKFRELVKERMQVQDKRAQVDGYKELLLKQRDIMLALTKRLRDRYEQIMILQEELDAYDAAQRKLEDALDQRTADVIAIRKVAIEEIAKSGGKTVHLQGALGAWGNGATGSQDAHHRGDSASGQAVHARNTGDGAVEACGSPGNSSVATDADAGVPRGNVKPLSKGTSGKKSEQKALDAAREIQRTLENERLHEQMNQVQTAGDSHCKENEQLKQQLEGFEKERQALKVIIESKMKLFVSEIVKSLYSLQIDETAKVKRQSRALMHLLDSTVHAMSQP